MRVNLAVSGKFHYHNYVRFLHKRGLLNRFYYAHKYSTNTSCLGVPANKLVNIWLKEYLLQGHTRFMHRFGAEAAKPFYRDIWQRSSLMRWSRCDLLHIMLHGSGRSMIERARSEGALILGEPVNAHPDEQNDILNTEYDRLGIKKKRTRSVAQKRILEELTKADHLLVASSFLKQSYINKGFDCQKISVLPYAVSFDRFERNESLSHNKNIFRVICVARISTRKGIYDLLEAWKILGAPKDGELLLIGRIDPEMQDIMHSFRGTYKHLPYVANEDLAKYFSESTAFVLPSLEDGFGLVCSEAMACRLPIITTTNTGASEIIENGKEGFVVPIRSPEAISEKLSIFMHDRERAIDMGKQAEIKVKSLYNWEGYTDQLIELYKQLHHHQPSQ